MYEYVYNLLHDDFLEDYYRDLIERNLERINSILSLGKQELDEERVKELAIRYNNIRFWSSLIEFPPNTYDLESNKGLISKIRESIPLDLTEVFDSMVSSSLDPISQAIYLQTYVQALAKKREEEGLTYYI